MFKIKVVIRFKKKINQVYFQKEVTLLILDLSKLHDSLAMYKSNEKFELKERMVELEKGSEKC